MNIEMWCSLVSLDGIKFQATCWIIILNCSITYIISLWSLTHMYLVYFSLVQKRYQFCCNQCFYGLLPRKGWEGECYRREIVSPFFRGCLNNFLWPGMRSFPRAQQPWKCCRRWTWSRDLVALVALWWPICLVTDASRRDGEWRGINHA